MKWHRFILPLFALAFLLGSCGKPSQPGDATSSDGVKGHAITFDGNILSGKQTVTLKTSKGDIVMELDADAAPKTVTNFIALAKSGYYDGLTFHRVIPSFMIQGGDPNGDGTGGESVFGPTFADEINAESYGLDKKTLKDVIQGTQEIPEEFKSMSLKDYYTRQGYTYSAELKSLPMVRGAVAMANRGPNTNGSQFFIVQGENIDWLQGKYTVFGNVTEGMDIVDAIANVPRSPSPEDKPNEPVTFTVEVKE